MKYLFVFAVGLMSWQTAGALTVHNCDLDYHNIYISLDGSRTDFALSGPPISALLAEEFPSNIMVAEESTDHERTDILATANALGAVAGTVTGPMGVSFGDVGPNGSFKNTNTGNVFGIVLCSSQRINVEAVLRDGTDGSLFSISLGSTHFASTMLGRLECYVGDVDAAAKDISLIPGAKNVDVVGERVVYQQTDSDCIASNGVPFDGNVCFQRQLVTRTHKIKACGTWVNYRNIKFDPGHMP